MELEITTTIWIDVESIVNEYDIDMNTPYSDIKQSVEDYVSGLDDCEYYMIGGEEVNKIVSAIIELVGEQLQMKLN